MKKKLLALTLALVMALSLAACGGDSGGEAAPAGTQPPADEKVYTIGICQLAPHPALDAATEGFQAALVEAFGEDGVTSRTPRATATPAPPSPTALSPPAWT